MSERSQFVVGHWRRIYRVPRDHPQPEAQRHQLDNLLNDRLIPALEASVNPLLEQQEGVWLINSLETSLTLDGGMLDETTLAEMISRQITRRLAQITSAPPDGENVRYFPSRAAFAAQFIRDRMDGSAEGWEYESFAGLRSLLLPQALREAVIRDGSATARGIIGILRDVGRWSAVLNLLTDFDAEQIWLTCTDDLTASGRVQRGEIERLVAHWSDGEKNTSLWANGKTMLRLWVARLGDGLSERSTTEQANAAASIESWLAFLDWVESIAPDVIDFDRFAAGDFAGIPSEQQQSYAAILPRIAEAAEGSGAWLEHMTRAVLRLPQSGRAQPTPESFRLPLRRVVFAAARDG